VEEGIRAPGLSAPGLPALKATWTPFRAIEWSLGSRSRFSPPSARLGLPPPPFTRSSPFGASLKIGESNDRRLSSDGSARASAIRLRGEEGRTIGSRAPKAPKTHQREQRRASRRERRYGDERRRNRYARVRSGPKTVVPLVRNREILRGIRRGQSAGAHVSPRCFKHRKWHGSSRRIGPPG
jgi:hypothetical protein